MLALAAGAWQPCSALAQDIASDRASETDTQFWFYAVAHGEIAEATTLNVDASARWREDARGGSQQTLRATVMRDVAEELALGGGAGVFEAGGATELRVHQQADARLGRVSSRTRLEQRFFERADRMELRLRQRLRYSQPVSQRFDAHVEGEWLHLLQTRDRGTNLVRNQWRARILVTHAISGPVSISAAYLAIYDPPGRDTGERFAHIPQIIMNYRF